MTVLGYAFVIAKNGDEGVQFFADQSFDLILTDYHMPVMDGIQMAKAIRQNETEMKRNHVPIIGITGDLTKISSAPDASDGISDFLTKPYTMNALRQMIIKWSS